MVVYRVKEKNINDGSETPLGTFNSHEQAKNYALEAKDLDIIKIDQVLTSKKGNEKVLDSWSIDEDCGNF